MPHGQPLKNFNADNTANSQMNMAVKKELAGDKRKELAMNAEKPGRD
jgi:hypothetical protein